jgi:hypothetical protein
MRQLINIKTRFAVDPLQLDERLHGISDPGNFLIRDPTRPLSHASTVWKFRR